MNKKRILWMTNVRFTSSNITATGTWLQPLAEAIVESESYEVYHIVSGYVSTILLENINGIHQYVLPIRMNKCGTQIPNDITCQEVKQLINEINPALVHVWGTESIWAYMKTLNIFGNRKNLLDMQGLMQSCYESYYGGLSFFERLQCYGLKEIIRPSSSLYATKRRLKRWALVEQEILKSYDNISYQSEWIKNRLQAYNLSARLFPTKIILRKEFYENNWKVTTNESPVIFTISSGSTPYKGLSILIKACSIIKQFYPDFILNVAGNIMGSKYGIRSGYDTFLMKLIKKYHLRDNVKFIGPISSGQITKEQLKADVCVIPSFVESYCLGFAEAMAVGVPTVTSYAAAMPTIAKDLNETLFYNSMDYTDCAIKIISIFSDKKLAESLSVSGRRRRFKDNDFSEVIATQLGIYADIL